MRILGVDPGERRIGLAICDPNQTVAVPVSVLERTGRIDADRVAGIAREQEALLIVVGLALRLDGSQGPQAQRALRFGERLAEISGLPVVFWDERFSTTLAEGAMLAAGVSRRRRKASRDAAAAAVILQDYIDAHPSPRA